ncbi:MAG: FkbM family methyltransferase, partial [bacterium]
SGRSEFYRFRREDLRLYLCERQWHLLDFRLLREEEGFLLLEIEGRKFYWPSDLGSADLPWLFAEVFYPSYINPSSYEHPEIHPGETQWVIDAGALEGFFSIYAFEKGANRVIALDPVPSAKRALEMTFRKEAADGRFLVVPEALGDTIGKEFMQCDPQQAATARLVENDYDSIIEVDVTTLDHLAKGLDLGSGGFIKMDIEGGEVRALMGGRNTLAEFRPGLAVAVYHEHDSAVRCRDIILDANPDYTVQFRGMYGWYSPPRPHMLFAW